jgi:hypothetical protein
MSIGNSEVDGKRVSGGRVEVSILKNDLVSSVQR